MNAIVCYSAFAASLFVVSPSLAAQQPTPHAREIRANGLYLELGGILGQGSVNYDRHLRNDVWVRVGYGDGEDEYGECRDSFIGIGEICEGNVETTMFLVMINTVRRGSERHMGEFGFGVAFGTLTDEFQPPSGESTRTTAPATKLTATLGYRWMVANRLLMRAGYTPSYMLRGETATYRNPGFANALGLSLGVAF